MQTVSRSEDICLLSRPTNATVLIASGRPLETTNEIRWPRYPSPRISSELDSPNHVRSLGQIVQHTGRRPFCGRHGASPFRCGAWRQRPIFQTAKNLGESSECDRCYSQREKHERKLSTREENPLSPEWIRAPDPPPFSRSWLEKVQYSGVDGLGAKSLSSHSGLHDRCSCK